MLLSEFNLLFVSHYDGNKLQKFTIRIWSAVYEDSNRMVNECQFVACEIILHDFDILNIAFNLRVTWFLVCLLFKNIMF